jgi:hypothetical protein
MTSNPIQIDTKWPVKVETDQFTSDYICMLIEMYRDMPVLWDSAHKDYHKRLEMANTMGDTHQIFSGISF